MRLTLLLQQLLILLHILCILINSFCFSERNKTGTCQLKGYSMANKFYNHSHLFHSLSKKNICSSLYLERTRRNKFLIIITSCIKFSIVFCSLIPSRNQTEDDGSLSSTDSRLDAPNCTLIKWFIYQTSSIGDFYIYQSSCSSGSKVVSALPSHFPCPNLWKHFFITVIENDILDTHFST